MPALSRPPWQQNEFPSFLSLCGILYSLFSLQFPASLNRTKGYFEGLIPWFPNWTCRTVVATAALGNGQGAARVRGAE